MIEHSSAVESNTITFYSVLGIAYVIQKYIMSRMMTVKKLLLMVDDGMVTCLTAGTEDLSLCYRCDS